MCEQCIWAKNTGRTLMCSCPESDERWNIVADEMQCKHYDSIRGMYESNRNETLYRLPCY